MLDVKAELAIVVEVSTGETSTLDVVVDAKELITGETATLDEVVETSMLKDEVVEAEELITDETALFDELNTGEASMLDEVVDAKELITGETATFDEVVEDEISEDVNIGETTKVVEELEVDISTVDDVVEPIRGAVTGMIEITAEV